MSFNPQTIFEVHLGVTDRHVSGEFYQRVLGFEIAADIARRDILFMWIGGRGSSMLGLWGPACPNPPITRGRSHFALQLSESEIKAAPQKLKGLGVTPLDFDGDPTDEPIVLSWMPALSVYFKDPDQHSLEFICMLKDEPAPEIGNVKFSEWQKIR